ncbi:kinase-like domain-containing protein [Zychaea mexicana]|uniref:kinase-like domain-containing protein n=1 Tax=Zychaea mexicana TaxID=64656 RepID=UPI0022FEBAF0|nr:kinase-like domain-containing protein [Zychaea mexicana]KAI9491817.1 kinase-like domain-containing protein [Zychaea mexicana]
MHYHPQALSSTCQIYATGKVSVARRTSVNELLAAAASSSSRPSLHPRRATTTAVITPKDHRQHHNSSSNNNNNSRRLSFTLSSLVRRFVYTSKKHHRHQQKDGDNSSISYSADLNDYEKLHVLGVGGTATVYACKHKPTRSTVAVKQIDLELLDVSHESKRLDGLRREIQIMKLCRHEHLLPTFQSFVSSSYLYIIMPMMSSGSCRDLLSNFFPEGLDEHLVACIMKQVVKGLQYLHENGLLHRDIKAANLLLDSGTVRLADFGVSSHLLASTSSNNSNFTIAATSEQQQGQTLRRRRSFVGTPCWMAPEILQHREYNQKVDIWALGITTFELASGWPPLCEHDAATIFSHVIHDPPPILDEPSSYTEACHGFIASCLKKHPVERISANEASYHPFLVQAPDRAVLSQFLQQLEWPAPTSSPYTNDNDDNSPQPGSSSTTTFSSSLKKDYHHHTDDRHHNHQPSIDWDFSERSSVGPAQPPPSSVITTTSCYPPSLYDNDSLYDYESTPVTPEDEVASFSKPLVHDRMLLLDTPSDFHIF